MNADVSKKLPMTKNGTAMAIMVLFFVCLVLILGKIMFRFLLLLLIARFLLFLISEIRKRLNKRHFERSFTLFLSQIILNMQSGFSFRSSFRSSISFFDSKIQKNLAEIYEVVTFSQQLESFSGTAFEKMILENLIEVDGDKKSSLQRLKSFRISIEMENFFRHRSRAITSSVRFQFIFLTILYLLMGFFIISEFGFYENRVSVLSSGGIFLVGTALFVKMGGKPPWKL